MGHPQSLTLALVWATRQNGTGYKTYWYGAGSEVLAEGDGSGNITNEYVFMNGRRIAKIDLPSGAIHYYLSDHLKSTTMVINGTTGAIEEDCDYRPYGATVCPIEPNHDKFTGKERDIETGLDYFGARYYGNAFGRWSSPDQKGITFRHIINPQKLSRYSYVLNNPIQNLDPDGMEEVTIVYRTFIPSASVTVLGKTNGGDNRGFSKDADAPSRTSITVRIETDPHIRPGNPIISVESHAGQSTTIKNGKVVESATATKGLPTATGTRDANGTAIVNIQQDTKNPLSPGPAAMTPGVTANLNVMVYQDASTTQVSGTAAQFPASELNVTRADGTTTPVIQYMPAGDSTPWSLLKPDRDVSEKKETPACKGSHDGCSE